MNESHSISKFLGPEANVWGPFGLLGLQPIEASPQRVEAALQKRLDQIDEHPHAFSPEADEVRLALHTAAAQLLDPRVRRELLMRFAISDANVLASDPEPTEPAAFELETPRNSADREPSSPASFEMSAPDPEPSTEKPAPYQPAGDFLNHGDWDHGAGSTSKLSGGMIAALVAGGVVVLVVAGVAILASTRGGGGAPATTNSTSPAPVATAPPRTESAAENSTATQSSAGEAAETTSATATADSTRITATSPRTAFREISLVIRNLRQLSETARKQPAVAANQFSVAVAPLADWWCDFDLAQRRAANDAVVEVVFALGNEADAARSVIAVLQDWASPVAPVTPAATSPAPATANDIPFWRTSFAVGMLTRLGNEGDLPRAASARVSEALNATLGPGRSVESVSFESGAAAAARLLASALPVRSSLPATDPARTKARVGEFVGLCRAVGGDDAAAVERMLIDAAEKLLMNDAEPDQDASVNTAVSEILMAIKWRKDGPARSRLLQWFKDERLSVNDLHVVTSTLVNKSSAEGVDNTMVLSIGASRDDRVRVRAMIAQAWGMADLESRDLAIVDLANQSRAVLQRFASERAKSELDVLAAAAHAARLCQAARFVWLGDPLLAKTTVEDTPQLIESGLRFSSQASQVSSSAGGSAPGGGKLATGGSGYATTDDSSTDSSWALSYLSAERNIPVRLERLAQLESVPRPISKTNASVLVEQAFFGSPAQVRLSAQQWVRKLSSDPAVIEAVLDQLPTAPRIASVAELVEITAQVRLPRVSHPQWELAARRELVARLLAVLAGSGRDSAIDFLAGVIANTYDRAAPLSAGAAAAAATAPVAPNDPGIPIRALEGVRKEWDAWHAEALQTASNPNAPLKLGEVERRRLSRTSVASGPIQTYAAEQLSLAELVSVVVAAERPAEAPRVRQIVSDLTLEKRRAEHVFEQIFASQRALLRLWLVRLGREADA